LDPILFRLGPLVVRSYPALVNAGLLLGAAVTLWRAERRGIDLWSAVDALLVAAVTGLVVGRATYVGVHWDYYAHHVRAAFTLWGGGLQWQGALLGGVAGAAAVSAVRGVSLTQLLDLLTPAAACLAALAWLACFMVGCAWGIEAYPGQGLLWALSLDLPDLYGIREPRVAVQLLGAGWSAVLLGVTLVLERRLRRNGATFGLWLTLHSLGALGLGFLRGDEVVSVAGWRVDQWANLGLGVVGGVLLLARTMEKDGT
jgi:phosphatidylglycerol:prolipoprotein diacylglycerol transferase